MSTRRSNQLS